MKKLLIVIFSFMAITFMSCSKDESDDTIAILNPVDNLTGYEFDTMFVDLTSTFVDVSEKDFRITASTSNPEFTVSVDGKTLSIVPGVYTSGGSTITLEAKNKTGFASTSFKVSNDWSLKYRLLGDWVNEENIDDPTELLRFTNNNEIQLISIATGEILRTTVNCEYNNKNRSITYIDGSAIVAVTVEMDVSTFNKFTVFPIDDPDNKVKYIRYNN